MNRVRRIWVVGAAIAVVPTTIVLYNTTVVGRGQSRVRLEVDLDYPGAKLREYLGSNISPREWAAALRPYETNISSCMSDAGYVYSGVGKGPTDIDELRVVDPRTFGRKYGYGFTLSLNVETSKDRGSVAGEAPADLSAGYAEQVDECSIRATATVSDLLAPAAVHQRAAELSFEYEASADMRTVVSMWSSCMKESGYEVAEPGSTTGLLATYLNTLQPVPSVEEYSEAPTVLSEGDVAKLQEFELQVFEADQACAGAQGLVEATYAEEAFVLEALAKEFPAFRGINFHSGG